MNQALSRAIFGSLALVFAAFSVALAVRGEIAHQSFKAFYCAGKAVAHREDPYRVEPVRACEHASAGTAMVDGAVEPAPLPGYALAAVALPSLLPARLAAILFALTVALAVALSALAVSRITGISPSVAFLAFTPLAFINVAYGEIVPYSLLGLCGTAYALTREKYAAAAAFAALSVVQPTLGFAVIIALLLFVPRARVPMVVALAVLAVLSFAALGIHENLEYFVRVLPLQAESELDAADQYSLAHVLFVSGLGATASLMIARIAFSLAIVLGLVLARTLAQRTGRPAYLVLMPAALALLFGLYVHDVEILAVIPAVLLIAADARTRSSFMLATVTLALLCVVWTQRLGTAWIVVNFITVLATVYGVQPKRMPISTALLTAAVTLACLFAITRIAPPPSGRTNVRAASVNAKADEFAPSAWKDYIDGSPALVGARYAPAAPTWVGLTLLIFAAL